MPISTPRLERSPTDRRRTADLIFRGALLFNGALTAFWLIVYLTDTPTMFFREQGVFRDSVLRVVVAFSIFYVGWGVIWWAVKDTLLKYFVGMSSDDRKRAFSSRMHEPYDVTALLTRYSERRIRITDMIGRRGRFTFLAAVNFYYLYTNLANSSSGQFVPGFTQDVLLDAVLSGWLFLSFYYANGFIAGTFYGPQSRIMDGVLGRANNLLVITLWTAFKFILVPIGAELATLYNPSEFAVVFAMIWGSYLACDACAEVFGSLLGNQRIKVWGIGDVNRKSVAGTLAGFLASLTLCLTLVLSYQLPAPWIALAVAISVSNSVLELCSPRGTDDFTMATTGALLCWCFGLIR